MPIGKSHRSQSDLVRTVLDDVAKASPAEYTEAFRRQISRLDSWTARIAAVGQVKAGKSTFLNALSGQPGLLPSDVNPWTSVITNMRINIDGDPALGARFDFFDDTSWQRIINGEPEMRALAEEMLPEFDADELRRHTEEMRARARRRLGNSYDRLLGAHHTFDTLSPDLVEQYVCVGPPDEDRIEGQAAGRYTAITKVADLYMRSGDFAVPTILTDTPGVNDPFMVRDEFTCQTLNNADIFLIVLSAHQALTEIDISLTRMLAHQGARQVIVFINRMDELDDYAAECAHIVQDVSNRLHEAAPEHGFSIAYGSAWWASLALDATTPAAELRDQADDPELIRFVQEIHGSCPEDPRLRLLLASGLPDVWRGVSDAIEFGSGARILTEIMGATRAQMNALTIVSRRRREALQEQIETYGTGNLEMVLTDLEADVTHLEETGRQMTRLIERTEIELDTALNAGWFELQKTMDDKMHDFLAQRVTAIRDTWEGPDKHSDSHLEIDLLPLRELMEADLRNGYALARRNIDDILDRALETLTGMSNEEVDAPESYVDMEDLPGRSVVAAFVTARKSVTAKLVPRRRLAFWKKADLDVKSTMGNLQKIIAAEVMPSSNKLVEAYTETLAERIDAGKERLRLVLAVVERMIEDRRARHESDRDLLMGSGDQTLLRQKFVHRLQGDIEELDDLLEVLATKEAKLHSRKMTNAA